MAFRGQGADGPQKLGLGRYCQESETDQRGRLEPAGAEVHMPRADGVIETDDLLPKLRTDATQQPVPKAWQAAQSDRRAVFQAPVGLRQRGQHQVALIHWRFTSAGP